MEAAHKLTRGIVGGEIVQRFEPVYSYSRRPKVIADPARQKRRMQLYDLLSDRLGSDLPTPSSSTTPQLAGLARDDMLRMELPDLEEEKLINEIAEFNGLAHSHPSDRLGRNAFFDDKIGWPRFERVFNVAARTGEGVEELRAFMISRAQPRSWMLHPGIVTDQTPSEIVKMVVREKILEHLHYSLPYRANISIKEWVNDRAKNTIHLTVFVKSPQRGAIRHFVGTGAERIRSVCYDAGQELMNAFRCEVSLKVVVGA